MPRKRSFWRPGPWRPSYRAYRPPKLVSPAPRRRRRASVKIRLPRIAQPRRRRSAFGRFLRGRGFAARPQSQDVFYSPAVAPSPGAPASYPHPLAPGAPLGSWDTLLAWIPYPPAYVDQSQWLVWWVVDPRDAQGCCEDCRATAAASPYAPPWVRGGNQLMKSPGDGQCRCGPACTCHLSYVPPDQIYWPALETLPPDQHHMLITPWEVQEAEHG